MDLTPERKQHIDGLSYDQLLQGWRFAEAGDPFLQGETGQHWGERMRELRGTGIDHASVSKAIGWGR